MMIPEKDASWIRRWFSRQDDFMLWCYFVILIVTCLNFVAWIVEMFATVVR